MGVDPGRRGARFARYQFIDAVRASGRDRSDVTIDITVASEQLPEQRPVVLLQPCLRDSLELEKQLVPGHFPLPQRARRKWMWHGKND